MSLTQQNLMKLAQKSVAEGKIDTAIQDLEEALRNGRSSEIVVALSQLYRQNKQEDQAYALLKEEPDLFSKKEIFNEYVQVLKANHFLIEALQVKNLSKRTLPFTITPVSLDEQKMIMALFKRQKTITQFDYEQLLKLDLVNFKAFAQSLLLDPAQNFAVRLSLCEDLVRLGVKNQISVWILGKKEQFVPAKTQLLMKSPVYQEIVSAIGSKFSHNPSQLPIMLGEVNLVLGSLYPKLNKFIDDPDSFTSDLVSFLKDKNGRSHQKLLEEIYQNLPK